MSELIDIGDHCTHCGMDTSPGTGLFVNRIPSMTETKDGYLCPDCLAIDCDRCGKPIEADTEVKPYDVYPEGDKRQHQDFGDGAYIVHKECLTADENQAYIWFFVFWKTTEET